MQCVAFLVSLDLSSCFLQPLEVGVVVFSVGVVVWFEYSSEVAFVLDEAVDAVPGAEEEWSAFAFAAWARIVRIAVVNWVGEAFGNSSFEA